MYFLAPDPEYYFLKPLAPELTGYTNKPVMLSCLCAEDAETVWSREGEEIDPEDDHYQVTVTEGENILEIINPMATDSGRYTCSIVKFGKEGESKTECLLNVVGILIDLCLKQTLFEHQLSI